MEMAIMMKKINDCPNEASRKYLAPQKAEILAKMKAARDCQDKPKRKPAIDPSLVPKVYESPCFSSLAPASSVTLVLPSSN